MEEIDCIDGIDLGDKQIIEDIKEELEFSVDTEEEDEDLKTFIDIFNGTNQAAKNAKESAIKAADHEKQAKQHEEQALKITDDIQENIRTDITNLKAISKSVIDWSVAFKTDLEKVKPAKVDNKKMFLIGIAGGLLSSVIVVLLSHLLLN